MRDSGRQLTTGAMIVKLWESRLDTDEICRRLGLSLKEYYSCLFLYLQKPITVQADLLQRL